MDKVEKTTILQFLNPLVGGDGLFLILMFCSIFGIALLYIILIILHAREENWQENWDAYLAKGNQAPIESTHISEISNLVSTKVERMADFMPGVLLIVGLLGTFIALGLTLDSAGSILQNSSAHSNANEAFNNMTSVMSSIGSKFKASTWGIIGFLLLKFILTILTFEKKRDLWCALKINECVKAHAEQQESLSREKEERLKASENLLISKLEAIAESNNHNFDKINLSLNEKLSSLIDVTKEQVKIISNNNKEISDLIVTNNLGLEKQSALIAVCDKNNTDNFEKVSSLLNTKLDGLVDIAKEQVKIISNNNKEISELIVTNNASLEEIISSSRSTSDAIASLTKGMVDSIEKMSQAASTMSSAAENIGSSSKNLNETIDIMKETLVNVLNDLNSELNGSVSKMNEDFDANIGRLASKTEEMSKSMNDTMDKLRASIKDSSAQQARMFNDFAESSKKFQKGATEMESKNKEILEKIQDSLVSVASTGRQIQLLPEKLGDAIQLLPEKLGDAMKLLLDINHKTLQGFIDKVNENESKLLKSQESSVSTTKTIFEEIHKIHEQLMSLKINDNINMPKGLPYER